MILQSLRASQHHIVVGHHHALSINLGHLPRKVVSVDATNTCDHAVSGGVPHQIINLASSSLCCNR